MTIGETRSRLRAADEADLAKCERKAKRENDLLAVDDESRQNSQPDVQ